MRTIRSSFAAVVWLLMAASVIVVLMPLLGEGQGQVQSPRGPRRFYLTRTGHDGNEALTACGAGFHMASLWEIFDPTQLRYDTTFGYTTDDSGSGPPSTGGWIRTGGEANATSDALGGVVNCNAWTSENGFDEGSTASLTSAWYLTTVSSIAPWSASIVICSDTARVWCVQD